MADNAEGKFKSGYVALIGKPNVGKSTLLNCFVGQKVSIVSNKPQTTRRRVVGIASGPGYQIAFIDTPGIHEPHTRLGKSMVDQARGALGDVDVILYVADASKDPNEEDKEIARLVKPLLATPEKQSQTEEPAAEARPKKKAKTAEPPIEDSKMSIVLCLNKMDVLRADQVVDHVEAYCKLIGSDEYMLTSATKEQNLDKLLEMILKHLPEGEPMFEEDEFTDQSSKFLAGELVREKILQATRQEIPHATAVLVEDWEEESEDFVRIRATIFVEKASQRAIIIGKHGEFLKTIGTAARLEIESLIGKRVYLELFVKVRDDWRMDPRVLRELEYSE
jgi:GTP-binding protein Era